MCIQVYHLYANPFIRVAENHRSKLLRASISISHSTDHGHGHINKRQRNDCQESRVPWQRSSTIDSCEPTIFGVNRMDGRVVYVRESESVMHYNLCQSHSQKIIPWGIERK